MAKYRVTGPDGKTYDVNAPDGATEGDAISYVRDQYYSSTPATPERKPDPYIGKSLEELGKMYRQARLVDAGDDVARKIADAYVRKEAEEISPQAAYSALEKGDVLGALTTAGRGIATGIDDVIRQGAKGVPVIGGLVDEANAATAELLGGNYDETLDYNRARDRYREAANPTVSTVNQLAGGIAGTVAGARALGLGYGAGGAVARPLAQRAIAGAAIGAPVGAADFFARGEGGAAPRAADAVIGGVLGGALGAAAPAVGGAVSSGVQRIADMLSSNQMLARLGISRNAANVLLRQLQTDDTLSGAGAQRIREAGPDAMVADAGQSAANLLDTALERSGPGSTAARNAINARAAGANQQLTQTLDATLGQPVGVETRQAAIRGGTAAARQRAYDAAYNAPIDYSTPAGQEIDRLWAQVRPNRRAAANALLEEAGEAPIADGVLPNVRQIDYVTRALNDVAQSGEGQGALGGINQAGMSAQRLAQQLRQAVRQAVPEYAQALDTAADPIRRVQATELGASILNSRVTREQVAREVAGMSGAERQAALSGLRDQIDEFAANVREMASDPNVDARQLREVLQQMTSRAAREKINLVLDDPQASRALFGQIGRAMRALELRASVARNSRTFGRQATDAQVKAQLEPGIIGTALEGRPADALKKAIQAFTGMSPERRLAAEDRLYGEIADALTRVRGTRAEQFLNNLRRALQARSTNRQAGRSAGLLATDTAIGAAPTPLDRAFEPSR